jgi:hypothetical protein
MKDLAFIIRIYGMAQLSSYLVIGILSGSMLRPQADPQLESAVLAKPTPNPGQAFCDFLAAPPWIKKLRFLRSKNYYIDTSHPGKPRRFNGFTLYEGALQSGGFYLRHLSNSIAVNAPRPGEEYISGASDRYWWQLSPGHDGLGLAPRLAEEGQSAQNGREVICRLEMAVVEQVRHLGMDYLIGATIRWDETNRFSGHSPQYGAVEGQITQYKDGLPTQVQYSIGTNQIRGFVVQYRYAPDRPFPPQEMVSWEKTGEKPGLLRHTNIIQLLETGIDEEHLNGYKPSDFRLKTAPLASLIIWSNKARFKIDGLGRWEKIQNTLPLSPNQAGFDFSRVISASVALAGAILAPLVVVLAMRQAGKNNARKTKGVL